MARYVLDVNGQSRSIDVHDPQEPLLYVLRNDLRLTGAKYGCGLGQCGACTVIVDGEAVRSCLTPISAAKGKITTIEGLGTPEKPHAVQAAFIEEQAAQCGYCTNGIMMTLAGLLAQSPRPDRAHILAHLDERHLCRCGVHVRVLKAIDRLLAQPEGASA